MLTVQDFVVEGGEEEAAQLERNAEAMQHRQLIRVRAVRGVVLVPFIVRGKGLNQVVVESGRLAGIADC